MYLGIPSHKIISQLNTITKPEQVAGYTLDTEKDMAQWSIGGIEYTLYNASKHKFRPTVQKLLIMLANRLTLLRGNISNHVYRVYILTDDYASLTGIDPTKRRWTTLKADIETLSDLAINGIPLTEYNVMQQRGSYAFRWHPTIAEVLLKGPRMQYPTTAYKLPNQGYSHLLAYKMLLQASMIKNKSFNGSYRLSVKTLVNTMGKKHCTRLDKQIIKPLTSALNAIPILNWTYSNPQASTKAEYLAQNVEYSFQDFPDMKTLIKKSK